jgi:hypothetical protein
MKITMGQLRQMVREAISEASTEKQRRWACANKKKKPEVAHICADTALSGKKKK